MTRRGSSRAHDVLLTSLPRDDADYRPIQIQGTIRAVVVFRLEGSSASRRLNYIYRLARSERSPRRSIRWIGRSFSLFLFLAARSTERDRGGKSEVAGMFTGEKIRWHAGRVASTNKRCLPLKVVVIVARSLPRAPDHPIDNSFPRGSRVPRAPRKPPGLADGP